MLKNYFKTAWRNIKVNKFYSIINICGLAVGLATGIMLLLWVQDERSYDKFNKDYQNIYELSAHFQSNGKEVTWTSVPGALAAFAKAIPQVKSSVRFLDAWAQVLTNDDRSKILDGFHTAYVDSSFLSIFDFKLLEGNRMNLFPDINAVVLTQSTAKKLFGDGDAMGKTMTYNKKNFTVTGILQDFPKNSSLQYDALFPMAYYGQQFTANGGNESWKTIDEDLGAFSFNTFVQLRPDANPAKVASLFSSMFKKAGNKDNKVQFRLQNLADIHLVTASGNDSALRMVHIFMLIAVLLLAIAAINYINLSTARASVRAREISIRKLSGANKKQLFFQFNTETFVLFSIAAVMAILMIYLLTPSYNNISGKDLYLSFSNGRMWTITGLVILGTLLASGIYPAVLLSSFRPLQIFNGKDVLGIGSALFRKIMVVFQFVIAVILIVSMLVMNDQMHYIRNKNLGFDKSYVLTVPLAPNVVNHIDAVKNELRKEPGIVNVATSGIYDITNYGNATGDIDWRGKPANSNLVVGSAAVSKEFIPTMKMHFIAGKNFSGTPVDSSHFILNETAVKAMGLKPPYVGQQISLSKQKGSIIGVLKDFNFKSLKQKVTPIVLYSPQWKGNILYVRTTATKAQQALAAVKKQYKKYADYVPFSYNFVDKQFEAKYKSDARAGMLFNIFAGIAIFISCLGLLGLVTFTAQRRTKEIGIRKVLGAGVGNILRLVSIDFFKLVVVAIAIAIPIAWLAMDKWLQDFAYRISISWWIFVVAGLLAIMIALITVSWQAIRAASVNPVDALRSE